MREAFEFGGCGVRAFSLGRKKELILNVYQWDRSCVFNKSPRVGQLKCLNANTKHSLPN